MHKLRYEVVPGFYATALLYEPEHLSEKNPAVLNVIGNFAAQGNTVELQQKFCIDRALRGMIALNLDWIGMGELNVKGNDIVGRASRLVAQMESDYFFGDAKRADYLAEDANVDSSRLGVTGLSGGGWRTIVLGRLDPRLLVSFLSLVIHHLKEESNAFGR